MRCKKIYALMIATAMTVSLFAGCNDGKDKENQTTTQKYIIPLITVIRNLFEKKKKAEEKPD